MSGGGGYGGDYDGKKPLKKRRDIITLWGCCECGEGAAMLIKSTPSCPFCYHYRCSDCPLERHRKRPDPLWLSDSPPRILSKEPRESPEVATSDSGTSLATPVAAGVAAKDLENANSSDIYGAERFLMSLRPKRRLLGKGSKGFTKDEIVSALRKAVDGKQPLPLINALHQLAELAGASGSTHTAVKRSGAIPTLEQIDSKMQINAEKAKKDEEERRKTTALEAEQVERTSHAYTSANPRSHNPDGGSMDLQSSMLSEEWADPAPELVHGSRSESRKSHKGASFGNRASRWQPPPPLPQRLPPPISAKQTRTTTGQFYVNSQPPPLPEAQDASPRLTSQVRTRVISEAKFTLEEFDESEYDSSDFESNISLSEDTESDDEQSARGPSPGRDLDPRNILPLLYELEALDQKKAAWQKMIERRNTLRNAGKQRTLAQIIGSDIDDEDLRPVQFDANEAGSSGSKVRHETENFREGSREIEEILGALEKEEDGDDESPAQVTSRASESMYERKKARGGAAPASGSSPNAKPDLISEVAGNGTNLEDETVVPSTESEHPAVTEPGDPEVIEAAASGRQNSKGKDRDTSDALPEQSDHIATTSRMTNELPMTAQDAEQSGLFSDRLAAIFRKNATITSLKNHLKQHGVDLEGDGTVTPSKETSLLLEEALRGKQETLPVGKRRYGTDLPESFPTDLGGKAKWTDMERGDDDWKSDTEFDGTKNTIPSADEESMQDAEAAKNSPPDNGKATAGVGFDAEHKPIGSEATIEALKECTRVPVKDYALAVIDEDGTEKIYTSSSSTPYQDEIFTEKFSNEFHGNMHDSGKEKASHARTVDEPLRKGGKQKDHESYGEKDPTLERGDGENGLLRMENYLRIEDYSEPEITRGDKYRPKNRPSKGDAVLMSFMDGGSRPYIAGRAGREPLASDGGGVHQESTQSFGEAIDAARDTIVTNRNTTPEIFFDNEETYSISEEQATRLDASLIHVEEGSEKHDNQVIREELDPSFPSSYLGEKWRGGAYGPSDLEEDNKAVTHQQAAEPVRTTAELDQECEENFRGGRGNQFFPCKYCPALQGDFGFWAFNHLKIHMKTKHNRELESESPISKRKISINGRKYEKDDHQPRAADRVFDGPENEARVRREIDVEDQVAPLLGRQDQPTPPALHTLLLLQTTEMSSSQMKVINSTGGHRLGSSRTDPWSSSGFVEEEEDEGWDRDEDNRDGSIRNEDVQENIYTTRAPVFAPETISYEDGAIETKSSTAHESLAKHYRATTFVDSKSLTDWGKLQEPFSRKLDDEERHETDRGSDSISSHSQNLNTIESELAEIAKMAKVYSTPGVRTEPANQKVDFEASIAAMRAEIERGKAEDAQAAADNELLTAEGARDVFYRHDERLPKADSLLEAVVEEDCDSNQKRIFNVAPRTTSPRNEDYIIDTTPSLASKFHPSKYEWSRDEHLPEKPFVSQTSTFKNSHYNTAHYKNPNFQPEEWNSNHHLLEKSENNSDGPGLDPILNIMRPDQFDGKDLGSEGKSETVKEILSNTGQAPGCATCRKHLIKCGKERPTCNNCIQSNRHCGYSQRILFKDPVPELHGVLGAAVKSPEVLDVDQTAQTLQNVEKPPDWEVPDGSTSENTKESNAWAAEEAELDGWMQLFDAAEAMKKDAEDTHRSIQERERATLQGLNIQREATSDNSILQGNALSGMLLKQAYDAARLHTDSTLAQQSDTSSQRSPMETLTDLVLPNASESHFSPGSMMPLGLRQVEKQEDERSEISSRSVSSVASVANSILSIITGSSMSSIIGPEAAAETLVQLLLGDHVIRPLCLEALIIVAHERFERNLRRLLGSFAIELKKEARNSQEINAARFVKFRARNSAHIICNRLRPKESMPTRKLEDKPVLAIEEFSDESDSDRSDDETNDLQQLEVFIKTSSALEVLRTNLRAFIYPQTQTVGPKPNGDISEVPSDDTDGHEGVKSDERSCNESPGAVTLPSQRSKLLSNMRALVKMQPRPVPEGRTRIAWKCKCGHKIEDDFIELQPGAAERYRQSLTRANSTETSSQISRLNSISSTLSGGLSSLLTIFSFGSNKSNDPELPLHERSQPCNQVEHGNSNPEDPLTPPTELLYLLLCYSAFNESRFATRLLQLDLVALKAKSDKCLFKILRENYQNMRSRWLRYISLRTLQSIKFVNFQMYKSALVDVRKTDVIPPPDDMDYRYAPAPPEVIPPIGERHLLHLFKHPEHAEDEPLCLEMFPKKLKEMLVCKGGVKVGWGIQFVEDWDWKKIWMIVFVIFGLGSAIVGVVWAVLGQNVQNAFAVAGYVVALSGVSMAFLQALLVM